VGSGRADKALSQPWDESPPRAQPQGVGLSTMGVLTVVPALVWANAWTLEIPGTAAHSSSSFWLRVPFASARLLVLVLDDEVVSGVN
jgi:hypothetical protein